MQFPHHLDPLAVLWAGFCCFAGGCYPRLLLVFCCFAGGCYPPLLQIRNTFFKTEPKNLGERKTTIFTKAHLPNTKTPPPHGLRLSPQYIPQGRGV